MNCKENRSNIWTPTSNAFLSKEILNSFLRKYKNNYSIENRALLESGLFSRLGHYLNPLEFLQIYSYLGLIGKDNDIYYGYYKKLSENFDIDCNILDVASGCLPAFGLIISGEQMKLPCSKGTITMCDPAIIFDAGKKGNMTLVKDKFDKEMIKSYDLITGIMPCSTTKDIITGACENNKDFYIGLCGCPPEDEDSFNLDDGTTFLEINQKFAKDMCDEYGRTLCVDHLDPNFYVRMPVIYSKKR